MKAALACFVLVVVSAGLIWFLRDAQSSDLRSSDPKLEAAPNQESKSQLTILADAPFAQKFGQEELSIQEELDLLQLAFQDYLSFVKRGYRRPIGDNRDFVGVMTGNNPYRIAPIPPQHPRINGRGELTDRLGIPYAIHPLAEDVIEVRAAGKDGVLWTDDDVVNLSVRARDLKESANKR